LGFRYCLQPEDKAFELPLSRPAWRQRFDGPPGARDWRIFLPSNPRNFRHGGRNSSRPKTAIDPGELIGPSANSCKFEFCAGPSLAASLHSSSADAFNASIQIPPSLGLVEKEMSLGPRKPQVEHTDEPLEVSAPMGPPATQGRVSICNWSEISYQAFRKESRALFPFSRSHLVD